MLGVRDVVRRRRRFHPASIYVVQHRANAWHFALEYVVRIDFLAVFWRESRFMCAVAAVLMHEVWFHVVAVQHRRNRLQTVPLRRDLLLSYWRLLLFASSWCGPC